MARVEGDVPHRRGVALGHDEVGVAAEVVEAVRRHVHREIDVAGLQRHQTRLRLDDRHVDGLPDLGRAAPVLIVAREDDLHARLPRLELERPRAHGVLDDVLAPLLQRFGTEHEERLVREVLQERCERRLELDLHGARVEHLDAGHVAEEALHVGIGARRVVGALVVQLALEDEFHGVGVEWRAVVERHVRAEPEGVGEAVPRDVPRLREPRHELVAAELLTHQPLEDPLGHARGVEIGDLRRIHRHRLGHEADDDRVSGRRAGGAADEAGEHEHEQERGETDRVDAHDGPPPRGG